MTDEFDDNVGLSNPDSFLVSGNQVWANMADVSWYLSFQRYTPYMYA